MAEQARELHGDPEAMLWFAERVASPCTEKTVRSVPDGQPCGGGCAECAPFTAADTAATLTLAAFLAETEQVIGELRTAARHAAADYASTDESGVVAIIAAVEVPSGGQV